MIHVKDRIVAIDDDDGIGQRRKNGKPVERVRRALDQRPPENASRH
jgi:hypothetical protein